MTAAASGPAFTSPPDPPVNLPPVTERSEAAADEQKGVDNLIKAAMAGSVVLLVAIIADFVWANEDYADYLAMLAALLLGGPIVWGAARALWTGRCSHDHPEGHGHGEGCDHGAAHAEPEGGSHMEELVALAILASFALGEYMECALVAFFMLIASLIEHRTAVGALRDIESLVRITPTRAVRLAAGQDGQAGREEEVAAAQLRAGDVVVVRPGDNVPADGIIRSGESSINQANITGESLPVEKQPGDTAYAGTINQTGRLEIEVTKAGEDSTLGKVKNLILQASQTRPAVVRELSKYTAYYTPVVLMLAAILFVLTENPEAAISLLLVACPCALILCGPTAVVASLSAASRLGIYVKSVADLEVVRRTTAFVMDKTGTLTTGELAVTKMRPAEGVDPAELLRLAATAEKDSRHPVARAVVAMAEKASVEPAGVTRFAEEAGRGVSVSLQEGGEVLVGREAFLNDAGVDASGLDMAGSDGLSLLYVARDGQAVGWVGMADGLRPGAAEAIEDLDAEGVKQRVMITGDRRSSAERVASQLALTGFSAEALPGDKLTLVEQLKAAGHTVAVIGDGVNDGPALAAGHVSIAMGAAGSDVAVDAATIALMNNELNRLPFLVRLSRKTVNVIRQNLVFTGVYIVFMLVLLGLGYLTPLWAAIGHGVSSIVVIFNSARLVREGEGMEVATPGRLEEEAPRKRVVTERVAPAGAALPA
ncbi:heavy metal translocating P-type ATPase [Phycisphaera mikurensis]|uniref:P-type Zn(2+) transporter n=1 Tax=Phycisphaera mikurensis (strain NBRC 102666 / KCTC 22515 / FYK2301M01) TaxID=1142394 RepID=I0IDD7_PHYMF|nr:cation-translocating P-type ATPase [Phycisphaera mikurensis]MBB6443338.1 Cd2+/Zn2+-exporting ATPase [Phycisphaera mikurensis]BAM03275.1 cation-transporting ATPase [Phycisphaera mikurensis NBRC 102666]